MVNEAQYAGEVRPPGWLGRCGWQMIRLASLTGVAEWVGMAIGQVSWDWVAHEARMEG